MECERSRRRANKWNYKRNKNKKPHGNLLAFRYHNTRSAHLNAKELMVYKSSEILWMICSSPPPPSLSLNSFLIEFYRHCAWFLTAICWPLWVIVIRNCSNNRVKNQLWSDKPTARNSISTRRYKAHEIFDRRYWLMATYEKLRCWSSCSFVLAHLRFSSVMLTWQILCQKIERLFLVYILLAL